MVSSRATLAVIISAVALIGSFVSQRYTAAGVFLILFLASTLTLAATHFDA
jgi:hypothetical protein